MTPSLAQELARSAPLTPPQRRTISAFRTQAVALVNTATPGSIATFAQTAQSLTTRSMEYAR